MDQIIKKNYIYLKYVIFLLAPMYFYNAFIVGVAGHNVWSFKIFFNFFLYSCLQFIFIKLLEKVYSFWNKIIRVVAIILLLLPLIYLGGLFYYGVLDDIFSIINIIAGLMIIGIFTSTILGIIFIINESYKDRLQNTQ